MTGDDHYTVLGVTPTASPREITDAFHRLVRRHHPDTRADDGDPADLLKVIAAYEVLRDPRRRAAYDDQHLPPRPTRPAASSSEPAIRVGPVRYHGRRW